MKNSLAVQFVQLAAIRHRLTRLARVALVVARLLRSSGTTDWQSVEARKMYCDAR
jgi:hypothetical protein